LSRPNSESVVDGYIYTFTKFKPGEVHKLTGMTPDHQRLWKRRGQMPLGYGDSEPITARMVAEIYVRHQLALNGLPPSESADIAAKAAKIVLWFALLNHDGACAVVGPKQEVAEFIDEFARHDNLANTICGIYKDDVFLYLYRYGGKGPFQFVSDIETVFRASPFPSITFLDLEAMGSFIWRQAGRPLLTVEIPSDTVPRSMWERRLVAG
jgi:hypothetical protein